MNKGVISILLMFALVHSSTAQHVISSPAYDEVLNTFSNQLYRIYSESSSSDNILFSSYSIHTVLAMMYQGSDGTTKDALNRVLTSSQYENPKDLARIYHEVIKDIENITNVTLNTANKLYISEDLTLDETFNEVIESEFSSQITQLNFTDEQKSIDVINEWVASKTNDKIKDLVGPSDISWKTKLMIVNAIYFKGEWNLEFDTELTQSQPFYNGGLNSAKKNVDIMHQSNYYFYANCSDLDSQIIEIPYKNNKVNLVVILPNKRDGLKEVESKLGDKKLDEVLVTLHVREVQLGLPKFKIEADIDLAESLDRIGLGEIFDSSKANFTKALASEHDGLYVSKAKQKAFIEVNEAGSEATTATYLSNFQKISTSPSPAFFQADHPFIFFITAKFDSDAKSNRILFQGRLTSI